MNTPLILGNDFADQFSLSILHKNSNTILKLGDSGYQVPLDNSVESSLLNVQALQARVQAIQHQKNNRRRKQGFGTNKVLVLHNQTVLPWTIKRVPVRLPRPTTESIIFNPIDQLPKRIANTTLMDLILHPDVPFVHITNDTDTPIHFQESDYVGTVKTELYYNPQPSNDRSQVQTFFNLIAPILQKKEVEYSEEQPYQDQQPDMPYRLKLAEVPDGDDIPTQELLSLLDFNPKLSSAQ